MWAQIKANSKWMNYAMPAHLMRPTVLSRSQCKKICFHLRKYCSEDFVNNVGKHVLVKADLFSGQSMYFETGQLAKMADGCATVTFKNTTLMAVVVCGPEREATNGTLLNVLYRQKAAALGRIPLSFTRREMGQTESEILTCRVVDRSLRPLFPKNFNQEVQITCNPLALDGSTYPDVLAINAASAALAVSHVPWDGPVGAVRVGLCDDEIVINPSKYELNSSSVDLIVTARKNKLIIMLEGCAANVDMSLILKCIKRGVKECQSIVYAINNLKEKIGKEKQECKSESFLPEVVEEIQKLGEINLRDIFRNNNHDKLSRDSTVNNLGEMIYLELEKKFDFDQLKGWREIYEDLWKRIFREETLETNLRCDGRTEDEVRPITCQVDLYKPLHGSALFQRGQTQVLCTVALDSPTSAMKMDNITILTNGIKEKNFFVHYEFPSYSTGKLEMKKTRREVGHGALAEKALKANVPPDFPFTIRLTSEVLESNGSSSMATVCGGSLALMDAGIPVENAVAGVAVGIITKYCENDPEEIEKYKILTDLMGAEDYFGDMDFKIAGTKKCITAMQLDMKIKGLPLNIISDALSKGKNAIYDILKIMNTACSRPRIDKKPNWPVIKKVTIPHHARSKFLGPGGINVKKLEVDTGVEISEDNIGEFLVFASNAVILEEAMDKIESILKSFQAPTLEFGGIYTATVVEVKEHGVMVTLHPSMQPVLVHNSQLDHRKIQHPSALGIKEGDQFSVKYFGRDPVSGVMRLSRKVILNMASGVVQSLMKTKSEQVSIETPEEKEERTS